MSLSKARCAKYSYSEYIILRGLIDTEAVFEYSFFNVEHTTRKLCYSKDDRAMRAI